MDKPATTILLADDDVDDRQMVCEALRACGFSGPLHELVDGQELVDRISNRGRFADMRTYPKPGLVLLDLNMPKKGGAEALREIKADLKLRHIPVVVLSTSRAEEDIVRSYDDGADRFISKPVRFEALLESVRALAVHWR